ncbi:MAG: ATP-binding protein [Candidatus Omnitrophica bacterium]|nr:ATP-binding protein [Candidatus Omnitrophota bacterium]
MIISVASGKGGTGKTTVAVNLALSIPNAQLLDCDVEEPNSHIFIKPNIDNTSPVFIPVPEIDESLCDYCGRCQEVCEYNAIAVLKGAILVFPELCHGCGACSYLCPRKAIKEVNREIGVAETGTKGNLQFGHGRLNIGEAMSPPLIKAVREYSNPVRTVIIDVPPGTSCPVISSIKGSDFCVLVTEPTPFGLNDLILAVEVLRKLDIPFGVVINRSDLGNKDTYEYCAKEKIPIMMEIPFKKEIAVLYSTGIAFTEQMPEYKKEFLGMYKNILTKVKKP